MTFKRTEYAEHGTMTRYRQHVHDKDPREQIDEACRKAKVEHDRQYQQRPERRASVTRQQKVRRRAAARLIDENPERMAELVAEEDINLMWEEMQAEKD